MALTLTGQLTGKRVSKYEGNERTYLQILDMKPDGSASLYELRCEEGVDASRYRQGEKVTVPVEFKQVKDKLYWNVLKETSSIGTAPRV